jgi:hypothetical protein
MLTNSIRFYRFLYTLIVTADPKWPETADTKCPQTAETVVQRPASHKRKTGAYTRRSETGVNARNWVGYERNLEELIV